MSARRKHTIPEDAHPAVQQLFMGLNEKDLTVRQLTEATGIFINTIQQWRVRQTPRLDMLEDAANAVGMTVRLVPLDD